jgi:hypothetical protein
MSEHLEAMMNATASTLSRPPTQASRSPHPLLAVMAWELRRVFSRRSTWLILPLAFGFFLLVIWLLWIMEYAGAGGFGDGVGHEVMFRDSVTSAEGMVMILPIVSFLLALIVPFVNTDGTAGDLKRRTHEIVMSTRLPSWAYLWGAMRLASC